MSDRTAEACNAIPAEILYILASLSKRQIIQCLGQFDLTYYDISLTSRDNYFWLSAVYFLQSDKIYRSHCTGRSPPIPKTIHSMVLLFLMKPPLVT